MSMKATQKKSATSQTVPTPPHEDNELDSDVVDPRTMDECNSYAHPQDGDRITITTSGKQAEKTVTPFLTKHVPEQYAPLGNFGNLTGNEMATRQPRQQHDDLGVYDQMSQIKYVRDQISGGGDVMGEEDQIRKKQTEQEVVAARPNTKYCYRHRPDLKCRRQADEPSMEQLQQEIGSLPQEDQQGIAHVWTLFSAAPSKHRNLMLRGILAQCCFQQLSFLSAAVRDLIKIDFLSALPTELGYRIFCYLDTTSLCKAAQVSRRWRILADDDVVWHRMCEQHIDRKCTECGWGLPLLERKRLRTEKRQMKLRAQESSRGERSAVSRKLAKERCLLKEDADTGESTINGKRRAEDGEGEEGENQQHASKMLSPKRTCLSPDRVPSPASNHLRPWKDVYKARFKVGTNWKHGRCTVKILRGHTNGVMCLQLDDHAHILATGSYDATIKIWDLKTGGCIRTLRGHGSGVRCLQFNDHRLISGSIDRTLKVWDWGGGKSSGGKGDIGEEDDTFTGSNGNEGSDEADNLDVHQHQNTTANPPDYCLRTLTGHAAAVIGLHFDGNVLASGSADRTVRVWDTASRNTFLLRGHTDWVNAVRVDVRSRTCFSASDDCTVRLWSLDTRACLRVFEGHVGQVQQIVLMPEKFEPVLEVRGERNEGDEEIEKKGRGEGTTEDVAALPLNIHTSANHPTASLSTTYLQSPSPSPHHHPYSQHHHHNNITSPNPNSNPNTFTATSTSISSSSTTTTTTTTAPPPPPPTYFLTSSLDSTVRLWSTTTTSTTNSSPPLITPTPAIPTSTPLKTFFGHVEGVWALAADTLRAASGAEDRTVKIWDPRTGACLRTFAGHQAPVTCVALGDCRLVSGGEDCEVRVLGFGEVLR